MDPADQHQDGPTTIRLLDINGLFHLNLGQAAGKKFHTLIGIDARYHSLQRNKQMDILLIIQIRDMSWVCCLLNNDDPPWWSVS